MNDAENYLNSVIKLTNAMNRLSLDKFVTFLRSKGVGNSIVLDVGCGDGSTTVHVLKPFLGSDVVLEASDVSESMINHAVSNYRDQDVKFFIWDVLDEIPVKNMINRYDQIYSFMCFHYCHDLRKVLMNVHNVLKPGGTLFFTMLLRLPFYEVFKKLSRYPAWASYLNDRTISQYSAPLQFEDNPEAFCRNVMSKCGFREVHINFEVGKHPMETWKHFSGLAKFGDKFTDKLPENMQDQYFSDYLHELKTLEDFVSEKTSEDGKPYIEIGEKYYTYIMCYGIKSN